MANIISKSRRVEHVTYGLFFESKTMKGAGYCFDCDEHGKLLHVLTDTQLLSWADATNTERHHAPVIQRYVNRYTEPSILKCDCGREVTLQDPLDNLCDCGRCYNLFGQAVRANYGRRECIEDGWAYDENDY